MAHARTTARDDLLLARGRGRVRRAGTRGPHGLLRLTVGADGCRCGRGRDRDLLQLPSRARALVDPGGMGACNARTDHRSPPHCGRRCVASVPRRRDRYPRARRGRRPRAARGRDRVRAPGRPAALRRARVAPLARRGPPGALARADAAARIPGRRPHRRARHRRTVRAGSGDHPRRHGRRPRRGPRLDPRVAGRRVGRGRRSSPCTRHPRTRYRARAHRGRTTPAAVDRGRHRRVRRGRVRAARRRRLRAPACPRPSVEPGRDRQRPPCDAAGGLSLVSRPGWARRRRSPARAPSPDRATPSCAGRPTPTSAGGRPAR